VAQEAPSGGERSAREPNEWTQHNPRLQAINEQALSSNGAQRPKRAFAPRPKGRSAELESGQWAGTVNRSRWS